MSKQGFLAQEIEAWIQEKVREAKAIGLVYGLSGGLDSSVVAALSKRALGDNAMAIIMPCNGSNEDLEHAKLMVNEFNLPHKLVNLGGVFNNMVQTLNSSLEQKENIQTAKTNLKPRLRMATLYYYAAVYGYLVMGTGNKSEIEIGYFTKYGDGGVDLEPIGHLLKEEVKELAVFLNIPEIIITKHPTAGLWEGQTDEEELGFSYAELDNYLKVGTGDQILKNKIEFLRKNSQHKRQMPPNPEK